ncbi:MAG: PIN domain-containing protein [Promethearchaeota archaeon]|nr:MAG: PIN domain-containing protein [Candidatus Lokiarchaeota archaeon]
MTEKVVIDAQVLFYFHYTYQKVPSMLQELKKKVIDGKLTVIMPTIAIAELLWKMRKLGKMNEVREAIKRWEKSENVIIDDFDLEIIKLMLENRESHELHDEIIAMTCKKYKTEVVYSTDKKLKEIFKLQLRSWK